MLPIWHIALLSWLAVAWLATPLGARPGASASLREAVQPIAQVVPQVAAERPDRDRTRFADDTVEDGLLGDGAPWVVAGARVAPHDAALVDGALRGAARWPAALPRGPPRVA